MKRFLWIAALLCLQQATAQPPLRKKTAPRAKGTDVAMEERTGKPGLANHDKYANQETNYRGKQPAQTKPAIVDKTGRQKRKINS